MRLRGLTAAGTALLIALATAGGAGAATLSGDFDGDGRDDLAVGVQSEEVGGFDLGGAVHVIYGGAGGLSARDRVFTRATPGIAGLPGQDGFGSALAAGDFDGDGFDDLAVGAPFDDVVVEGSPVMNGGSVQVIYGSRGGLRPRGDQLFAHGRGALRGPAVEFQGFGWTLAAGDLLGDGRDDLAITTIRGTAGGVEDAGYVEVLRGSRDGLTTQRARRFSQASRGIGDVPEAGDRFGVSLAAGEVGRSRHADLAIGVSRESTPSTESSGLVHVLFGARRGVRGRGSQTFDQDAIDPGNIGVDGASEADDLFGAALAIGDFSRGGRDDLAVGSPGEDRDDGMITPPERTGMVSVARTSREGVRTGGDADGQAFFEPQASGAFTTNGAFGTSLSAGNVGFSREDDVIAGAPGADPGGGFPGGAVAVLYGGPGGIADSHAVSQDTTGIEDVTEQSDLFGFALTVGRFDGAGPGDLAIGVPAEDLVTEGAGRAAGRRGGPVPIQDVGAVAILRGTGPGISFEGDRLLAQGRDGLGDAAEASDFFGVALSGPSSGPTYD